MRHSGRDVDVAAGRHRATHDHGRPLHHPDVVVGVVVHMRLHGCPRSEAHDPGDGLPRPPQHLVVDVAGALEGFPGPVPNRCAVQLRRDRRSEIGVGPHALIVATSPCWAAGPMVPHVPGPSGRARIGPPCLGLRCCAAGEPLCRAGARSPNCHAWAAPASLSLGSLGEPSEAGAGGVAERCGGTADGQSCRGAAAGSWSAATGRCGHDGSRPSRTSSSLSPRTGSCRRASSRT